MTFLAFDHYVRNTVVNVSSTGARSNPLPVVGQPVPEEQSSDYESGLVYIDSTLWRIRTARVTPTKPGAFVAVWERDASGATRPFGVDDPATGLLVFVGENDPTGATGRAKQFERNGVFTFSAARLAELGITRSSRHPGKRGFRVYPPWSVPLNETARRSQREQAPSFVELSERRSQS